MTEQLPKGQNGLESFRAEPIPASEITVESLMRDNSSPEADQNRRIFAANQRRGRLHVVKLCGDARGLVAQPERDYVVTSIAASTSMAPFERLINTPAVQDTIIVTHFDGETLVDADIPGGCGGLGEKAKMGNDNNLHTLYEGVMDYVDKQIDHSDVVVQSVLSAQEAARLSDKPVLAATQDHRTGQLYLLGAFLRRKGTLLTVLNDRLDPDAISPQNYDPARVYEDGIPAIDPNALPAEFESFREYYRANQAMVTGLFEKFPDLMERQKVQNPKAVVLTTNTRPLKLILPGTFGQEPNKYFKLSLARISAGGAEVTQKDLLLATDQAEYPITHATQNHGDMTRPFSDTSVFIIDTPRMDLSNRVARSVMQKPWMQEWLGIDGNKVITLEARSGIINQGQEFKLS